MIKKKSFFDTNLAQHLFPSNIEVMPNVDDIFELEFALGEINSLTESELLERSGFIAKVNGKETNHYKLGINSSLEIYETKSVRTQSFFSKGKFSTGYAVHSLFPYRGKFHAQLIKGIINVIGLKPGDTFLDPMMGSGTACIEAQLMGINAIGFDVSPFCQLMTSTKSLSISRKPKFFKENAVSSNIICKSIEDAQKKKDLSEWLEGENQIFLLAYLDAMGYARRVVGKKAKDKFPEVLDRYIQTIARFWLFQNKVNLKIGKGQYAVGDARSLNLYDNVVDGIITSPPYSFAIDYIDNDLPQLEFLGVNPKLLRENLVGLRNGPRKTERINAYLDDLKKIFSEMSRVLRLGKFCVIVIGSNEIQTGGIRFEQEILKFAPEYGFSLEKQVKKPIRGIQNSMTEEYVLFFRKVK